VPQPCSAASARSARSGFTTEACPTAASIGASVAESLYAALAARS
jgi:hypothetical protein